MPHTSRKKRPSIPAQKRLQVTDDDGWTHVTSGSNVRRVMRTARGQLPRDPPTTARLNGATDIIQEGEDKEPELKPAEAPARVTSDELWAQYTIHRKKWLNSVTWKILRSQLGERMRERMSIVSEGRRTEIGSSDSGPVDAIVCIGLGSPSGFLRDGWVDRRTVSMYQLAALEAIKEQLSHPHPTPSIPLSFPVYAQDPVFNDHDKELLVTLGITVVPSPNAFNLITPNTLLFCPGAERKHLELVLPSNPFLVFGGPLEDTGSSVIQKYVGKVESRVLVPFEGCEHAFWRMSLYFRGEGVEEENGESVLRGGLG